MSWFSEFEEELSSVKGATVTEVSENTLTFDNGVVIDMHPYETYVYVPEKGAIE